MSQYVVVTKPIPAIKAKSAFYSESKDLTE